MSNRGDPEFAEKLLKMSDEEVLEFWREEQRMKRDAGEDHHRRLLELQPDGTTKVVTTIDG